MHYWHRVHVTNDRYLCRIFTGSDRQPASTGCGQLFLNSSIIAHSKWQTKREFVHQWTRTLWCLVNHCLVNTVYVNFTAVTNNYSQSHLPLSNHTNTLPSSAALCLIETSGQQGSHYTMCQWRTLQETAYIPNYLRHCVSENGFNRALQFLADRTNGRAIATLLRLSSVVCNVMYCG